jgi:hypothetical protein
MLFVFQGRNARRVVSLATAVARFLYSLVKN